MIRQTTFLLLILGILWGCSTEKRQHDSASLHFRLNDSLLQNPITLLYEDGNYHLFYSYKSENGVEKWGQAQSLDLIQWNNVPMNFESDQLSAQQVKSVVVDWNQSTEFSTDGAAIIAISVSDDQFGELELLHSEDNGASWLKDTEGPILLPDYYEPIQSLKVFWNDDLQRWTMLVLSGYEVRFYSSDNLRDWEYQSRFGDDVYLKHGNWTAVDFFPMEMAGTHELKWVLFISADSGSPNEGSGVQYFVGDFDGYVYQASHNKPKWVDHGSDLYQAIVLSDYAASNKAPVLLGRIYNSIYSKFNIDTDESGVFSITRELTLMEEFHDYYLISKPVIPSKTESKTVDEAALNESVQIAKKIDLPVKIDLTFDVNDRLYLGMAESFGVKLKNENGQELMLGYQAERRYFFIANPTIQQNFPDTWDGFNYAPYVTNEPTMDLTLIIDHNSAELFAMNGLISLSRKFNFKGEWQQVELFAEKGAITLKGGTISRF
ncbi:glycoside hydrolase family 32 protein [Mangrovibacterium diazotrophicum]|uniref:Fructan beta-fructosidase n=1 Tax=Mangrovibacterium diazotrophicum TaxID=1261403 RepID=A0A419W5K1_9BACT|nr:glycoside hydrolase family 32 protein [Mangrovibacterium diazotrophicum]RKD90739.1 fructan beta-fructosidase [Mangrovibacterium diazotrophicum]